MMKLYTRANLAMIAALGIIPQLGKLPATITGGATVAVIEALQAFSLFCGFILTALIMRPRRLPEGMRQFWRWSMVWWLVLLGRSTSWGRDYFPAMPHPLLRGISVLLIGALILMLLQPSLRRQLVVRGTSAQFPWLTLLLSALGFLGSDCVEHHRLLSPLLLAHHYNQDFVEELFEVPLIGGLLIIALGMMRDDKARLRAAQ